MVTPPSNTIEAAWRAAWSEIDAAGDDYSRVIAPFCDLVAMGPQDTDEYRTALDREWQRRDEAQRVFTAAVHAAIDRFESSACSW